jgi:hypothetical protein
VTELPPDARRHTCRQFDDRSDATAAHAGLTRALTPKTRPIKLYLAATNVRTGKIKVFQNDEIGPDAVLASACLPLMFQAVEIDGEHYWSGGYMGNPRRRDHSHQSARAGEAADNRERHHEPHQRDQLQFLADA